VLGRRVFADAEARQRLEAIVHPLVRSQESAWARGLAAAPGRVAVTDAALLVEGGLHLRFRRLVVVHCRVEQQLARLLERGTLSRNEALSRISAQMPPEQKVRYAHHVVDTSGRVEDTDRAATALAVELKELAATTVEVDLDRDAAAALLEAAPPAGPGEVDVSTFAAHLAERRGLEMPAACALLGLPASDRWWKPSAATKHDISGLAPVVAIWCALVHGHDPPWLHGAMASLGRATRAEETRSADAMLLARAALFRLAPAEVPDVPAWCGEIASWSGGEPSAQMRQEAGRLVSSRTPVPASDHARELVAKLSAAAAEVV
jgi:hypothetical protein